MSTLTQPRARVKPRRSVRLLLAPHQGNPGVVLLTVGGESAQYLVQPVPSDFGSGYKVEKLEDGGAAYHVHFAADGGRSCECKGFLRWGRCKHADGLAKLRELGLLADHPARLPAVCAYLARLRAVAA